MTEETPVQQAPALDLDGKLYDLDKASEEAKALVSFIQQNAELQKLKEAEFQQLNYGREAALNQLRGLLADTPFVEKPGAPEEAAAEKPKKKK